MKKRIIFVLACLAVATGMLAEGVRTLTFGSGINNVRIYGDTLFAATCESVQWYSLKDDSQYGGYALCVVVYDYLRSGGKCLEAYTDDACYQQHPQTPDRIYRSEQLPNGQMGYTLSRSADFGQTWWTTGLRELQLPGRPQIAFNPQNQDEMYVFGTNEYVDCICPWVLHTTDGMETLQSADLLMDEDRPMVSYTQMAFSPTVPGLLLLSTTSGMARSEDDGHTWHYTTSEGRLFTDVCFDDQAPHVAYAVEMLPTAVCDNQLAYAVLRSDDDGQTWQEVTGISFPMFRTGTTTGLHGLQCYKGQLVCWADDHVYLIDTAQLSGRNISAMARAAASGHADSPGQYDLSGRSRSGKVAGLVVSQGRKTLAK